jgi:hypothetical protein
VSVLAAIDELIAKTNEERRWFISKRHFVEATASAIRIVALEDCRRLVAIDEKNRAS